MKRLLLFSFGVSLSVTAAKIDADQIGKSVNILELIEKLNHESKEIISKKLPYYEEEFRSAIVPRRRMIAALALGIHYKNGGHFQLAYQYLSAAKQLLERRDPMENILLLAFAEVSYAFGDYEYAEELGSKLLSKSNSSDYRERAYILTIKSQCKLQLHSKLIQSYQGYLKNKKGRTTNSAILKLAGQAYQKLEKFDEEIKVLEKLAEAFPLHREAVWAFHRLKEYNCPDEGGKRLYYFSSRLLRRISINRKLDSGIEPFLTAQLQISIRDKKGRPEKVDLMRKAQLLLNFGLTEVAKTYLSEIHDLSKHGNPSERADAFILLGKIYSSNQDPSEASRYYSEYLVKFKKHFKRNMVRSYLARELIKVGAFQAASDNYQILGQRSGNATYRWEHFWNKYQSNDYEGALTLLQKHRYVKSKDPKHPLALKYWEARILEKLGRSPEAKILYRDIISKDATSFYTNLSLARAPELWEANIPSGEESASAPSSALSLPLRKIASTDDAMIFPTSGQPPRTSLQEIYDLIGAGLNIEAQDKLRKLSFNGLAEDRQDKLENVAEYLSDYRAYQKIALGSGSHFRKYPKGLKELMDHQLTFKNTWQVYFPIAYENILQQLTEQLPISPLMILSLIRAESRYDVRAESWAGARGLMQIMPKTAIRISEILNNSRFHVDDLYDPKINITYGGFYINMLMQLFDNNYFVAIAAYNAGPIAVNSWLERCENCQVDEFVESIPYAETRRYVKEVIGYFGQYSRIYKEDQPFWDMPSLPKPLPNEDNLF